MSGALDAITHNLGIYDKSVERGAELIARGEDPNAIQVHTTLVSDKGAFLRIETEIFRPTELEQQNVDQSLGDLGYWSSLNTTFERIDQLFGNPNVNGVLGSAMSDFRASIMQLAKDPTQNVRDVNFAEKATALQRKFSAFVQEVTEMRQSVDSAIEDAVNDINTALETLANINMPAGVEGTPLEADFQTQKIKAFADLSRHVAFQASTPDGNLNIRVGGSQVLASGSASQFSFTPNPAVGPYDRYPDKLSGVKVVSSSGASIDLTTKLGGSGSLAALFKLRDEIIPGVLENVLQIQDVMASEINHAMNQGASYKPRSTLSSVDTRNAAESLKSSGSFTVAVVDADQKLVSKGTVALADDTVAGLIVKINAALGANGTASIGADGALKITATNGANGIALHEGTSSVLNRGFNLSVLDKDGNQYNVAFDTVAQDVDAMNAAIAANADLNGKVIVRNINGNLEAEGLNGSFVGVGQGLLNVTVQDGVTGTEYPASFDPQTQNVAAINAAIALDANLNGKVQAVSIGGSIVMNALGAHKVFADTGDFKTSATLRAGGLSYHFGFNNIFDASLNLSAAVKADPLHLSFGALDTSAAVGATALTAHGNPIAAGGARPIDLAFKVFDAVVHFGKTSGALFRRDGKLFDRVHDAIEVVSTQGNIVRGRTEDASMTAKVALGAAGLKMSQTEVYLFFMRMNQGLLQNMGVLKQLQRNENGVLGILPA